MFRNGGAAFPDLSGDGEVTQKDILMGRGVIPMAEGGVAPVMNVANPDPMVQQMAADPQIQQQVMGQMDQGAIEQGLQSLVGEVGDLENMDDPVKMMNAIRENPASLNERYDELASIVGEEDAKQTPESVLVLVQPTLMMANTQVDQGIGGLAAAEMTETVEGPMAGGIMSNIGGGQEPPANFRDGGLVRRGDNQPVPVYENGGPVYMQDGGNPRLTELFQQQRDLYGTLIPESESAAELARQREMTQAQMLFDIAQGGLALAGTPSRSGQSTAERIAEAFSPVIGNIGVRAGELNKFRQAQDRESRALDLEAMKQAQALYAQEKKSESDLSALRVKAALDLDNMLKEQGVKNVYEMKKMETAHEQATALQDAKLAVQKERDRLERERKERQDAIENAREDEKLELERDKAAFDKQYKLDKLALDRKEAELNKFGKSTNARVSKFFSDPERVANYAANLLSPEETLEMNQMIAFYAQPKNVWNEETKTYEQKPGNPISEALTFAVQARSRAGLPVPNIKLPELANAEPKPKPDTDKEEITSSIMRGIEDPTAAFGTEGAAKSVANTVAEIFFLGAPFKAEKEAIAGAEALNTKFVQVFQRSAELRDSVMQLELLKNLTPNPANMFTGPDAAGAKVTRLLGMIDEAEQVLQMKLDDPDSPLTSKQVTEAKGYLRDLAQLRAGYEVFDNAYEQGGAKQDNVEKMRAILGLRK